MPRGPVAGGELKNALDQLIAVPNVPGRTFGLGNGGGTVRRNWYDSTGFERASVRGALRAEDREKLCNWLGWKKQTLQRALTEGKALTSDILVLGIVSTVEQSLTDLNAHNDPRLSSASDQHRRLAGVLGSVPPASLAYPRA